MYLLNKVTWEATVDKKIGDEDKGFPHFLNIS